VLSGALERQPLSSYLLLSHPTVALASHISIILTFTLQPPSVYVVTFKVVKEDDQDDFGTPNLMWSQSRMINSAYEISTEEYKSSNSNSNNNTILGYENDDDDYMEYEEDPSSSHRKIFLENVPDGVNERDIAITLRNCGTISKIWLYKDNKNNISANFGKSRRDAYSDGFKSQYENLISEDNLKIDNEKEKTNNNDNDNKIRFEVKEDDDIDIEHDFVDVDDDDSMTSMLELSTSIDEDEDFTISNIDNNVIDDLQERAIIEKSLRSVVTQPEEVDIKAASLKKRVMKRMVNYNYAYVRELQGFCCVFRGLLLYTIVVLFHI